MNENCVKLRELIAANKIQAAIQLFTKLDLVSSELKDQLGTLSAKFIDVQKKDSLGLISSNQAVVIRTQVTYALLNLVTGFESGSVTPGTSPGKKTVFISYNHSDVDNANRLKEMLEKNNISVTIDSEKAQAGDDIKKFIENCIRDTQTTISIVSKKSLLSAWVAMETINTFYLEKTDSCKKFIACYIEDDFFNRQFTDEALDHIDAELKEIETLRINRAEKGRDTWDINEEYTRLKDLKNNLDRIIGRLRASLCIDIRNEKLEMNFGKILEKIRS